MKRKSLETFIIYNNKLIREMEPIYEIPGSKFGRAHFFSATKRVGNFEIETLIFNILAIWIMVLILYISLCYKFYLK
jgi:hypothetical protein